MTVKMILAVDYGGSIGWSDGSLPWKLPADMSRFKALTTGHTIVMGRKTFESFNRPKGLPNRHNVVISNSHEASKQGDEGVRWFRDGVSDSLKTYVQVHQACLGCVPPDLWIIGGATIYDQAIKQQLVDEIYLTQVHALSGADVLLPFHLWEHEVFIANQKAFGVTWELTKPPEYPMVPLEGPKIAFIHLKKVK